MSEHTSEHQVYLTVTEVASRLRLTPITIRRWLSSGKLRGFRPGGDKAGWRISERDLDAFIRERRRAQEDRQ